MRYDSGFRRGFGLLGGAAIGALVMYMLDPGRGTRRRALVRDKAYHFARIAARGANKQGRNLGYHLIGYMQEARAKIRDRRRAISDDTLVERVRAQLGHVVSHMGSLMVRCDDGFCYVEGPVLRGERERIEERLKMTRGVRDWDLSGIIEHDSPENIPGLQGVSRLQTGGDIGDVAPEARRTA